MKKINLIFLSLLFTLTAHAFPGRKEFIVTDYKGNSTHFIAYDKKRMIVLIKTNQLGGSPQIMCGNTILINDLTIWDNKKISFQDKDYGIIDGEKISYEDKKTELLMLKEQCLK